MNGRQGRGGRGSQNKPITDRYYSPQEWQQMSSEQQQKVRDLRADRDKRRGLQAVTSRNVRPKTEDGSTEQVNAEQQSNSTVRSGVAVVSSQRSQRNF